MSLYSVDVMDDSQPGLTISDDTVYFAFADGCYSFDCVQCDAQCCRGHGYVVQGGREFDAHLLKSPNVRFFAERCDAENHYNAQNYRPACFFLTADGGCSIHRDWGYESKPHTCRLFPFNNIVRVGKYLVVAPHDSLCPLETMPVGTRSNASVYDVLLAELRRSGPEPHLRVGYPVLAAPLDTARSTAICSKSD